MRILPIVLRWFASMVVVETARVIALRWLRGDISLQHMWDKKWRESGTKCEDQRQRHGDGEKTPRSATKAS